MAPERNASATPGGHRHGGVLAEADVVAVDQRRQVVALQRRGARVAGVDDAHRRKAHGGAGTRHVAERRHARHRVAAQLLRGVGHRREELVQLGAEDVVPAVQPDGGPVVDGGVPAGADQRIGEQVLHDRVVGAVVVEVVDPAVCLQHLVRLALRGGADGVADQAAEQAAEGLVEQGGGRRRGRRRRDCSCHSHLSLWSYYRQIQAPVPGSRTYFTMAWIPDGAQFGGPVLPHVGGRRLVPDLFEVALAEVVQHRLADA